MSSPAAQLFDLDLTQDLPVVQDSICRVLKEAGLFGGSAQGAAVSVRYRSKGGAYVFEVSVECAGLNVSVAEMTAHLVSIRAAILFAQALEQALVGRSWSIATGKAVS